MKKIGSFKKVSFNQFYEGYVSSFGEARKELIRSVYDQIRLPQRATAGSAGYDFYAVSDFTLAPGETVKLPTGIRARISEGWALFLFPRSGLGFRYRLQLNNTVGVIDSDYFGSDNEGHIFAKITNDSNEEKTLTVKAGEAFMQGVFLPYGITEDDEASGVRNGGFGSTT